MLAALLAPDVTRADYRRALECLLGFNEPLEAILSEWLPAEQQPASREVLHADLHGLGLDTATIAALPRCPQLPPIASASAAMGAAWVLHGSALGGAVIHRHLRERLGPGMMQHARHFAATPPPAWPPFLAALEEVADPPAAEQTARETFAALGHWLARGGA